ncbi:MAG TPA: fumarate reductase/succinate dehydrogenase flavoprotein subunit, partial [Thermoanaerobaculia bacterium]|nr:fumarate reductase/succinate dehydrogenase flavoprotein subunit [Thermoanaerobaculia bacterium]
YTMGGLWVDYELMSTIPGCFIIGEANYSDHGANRLGASALMQGLADGYFVIPATIANYLADKMGKKVSADRAEFKQAKADVDDRVKRLLSAKGTRSVDSFHRELGHIMWEKCGMARSAESLKKARVEVRALRDRYWREVRVTGTGEEPNQALEKAGRVGDFFELAELMCIDALQREESCGSHFRVEYQTADGEALRNDDKFLYVAAWEFTGDSSEPRLHKEPLHYEEVKLATRSYK